MQALISTIEPRESGYRVAQVEPDDKIFPVAIDLFWTPCPDNIVADFFLYDPVDKIFYENDQWEQVSLLDEQTDLKYKTQDEIDEEQRVLYVAITRPRKHLALSWSKQANLFNRKQFVSRFASRLRQSNFIQEKPAEVAARREQQTQSLRGIRIGEIGRAHV